VSLPFLLSLGQVQAQFSVSWLPLSVCCDGSLFVPHTAVPSDCGCPGSEPYSLLPLLLLYFRQWPITSLLVDVLLFVYDDLCGFSSLLLPPFLVHFQQTPSPPPNGTDSFQFRCLFRFSCVCLGASLCPVGFCWFIPGVAEGYHVTPGSHLFGLSKVSQALLELVAGSQWPVAVVVVG
jgi:hypothetical protein